MTRHLKPVLLVCCCSMILGQGVAGNILKGESERKEVRPSSALHQETNNIETSVTDTSALLAAWKHKTLTDHVLKATMGPTCFAILILAQTDNPSRKMRTIPALTFYGMLPYGLWRGFRDIKNNERRKLAEIGKGGKNSKVKSNDTKLNPYRYGLSMLWHSVGGFFAGALVTGTLEYMGYGLLKTPEEKFYRGGAFSIGGGVVGFYKGLESANKRHGLPPGSPLTSLLLTTIVFSGFEYGYHKTIGENSIPDYAGVLTFSMVYIGYNLKNWYRIISIRQLR